MSLPIGQEHLHFDGSFTSAAHKPFANAAYGFLILHVATLSGAVAALSDSRLTFPLLARSAHSPVANPSEL